MKRALTALRALSQESRLTVFRALVSCGPAGLCADELAAAIDANAAALAPHVKPLLDARLVSQQRHGGYVIYMARYDEFNALVAYLMGAPRHDTPRPRNRPARAWLPARWRNRTAD